MIAIIMFWHQTMDKAYILAVGKIIVVLLMSKLIIKNIIIRLADCKSPLFAKNLSVPYMYNVHAHKW